MRAAVPDAEVTEIGSTAVPGVIGKQDIDLLLRVPAVRFAETRARLDAAFERDAQQLSNDCYQGYRIPSALDIALQVTVEGGPYDDFLPFLEALRASPELIAAYNALKRDWDGHPMDRYRAEKARFIEHILAGVRPPPS